MPGAALDAGDTRHDKKRSWAACRSLPFLKGKIKALKKTKQTNKTHNLCPRKNKQTLNSGHPTLQVGTKGLRSRARIFSARARAPGRGRGEEIPLVQDKEHAKSQT